MTLVIRFEAGLRPILKHQEHDQSSHGSWAKVLVSPITKCLTDLHWEVARKATWMEPL
jgi:hypothetical protein